MLEDDATVERIQTLLTTTKTTTNMSEFLGVTISYKKQRGVAEWPTYNAIVTRLLPSGKRLTFKTSFTKRKGRPNEIRAAICVDLYRLKHIAPFLVINFERMRPYYAWLIETRPEGKIRDLVELAFQRIGGNELARSLDNAERVSASASASSSSSSSASASASASVSATASATASATPTVSATASASVSDSTSASASASASARATAVSATASVSVSTPASSSVSASASASALHRLPPLPSPPPRRRLLPVVTRPTRLSLALPLPLPQCRALLRLLSFAQAVRANAKPATSFVCVVQFMCCPFERLEQSVCEQSVCEIVELR
ncbi:hypothetical protein sr13757 [Sporisorium reilianum SRZ2]|uniref:Uncharacterized protein n=1 Tax=Sporisorium reilianum (strain SRZ2) TaxID=999809 RepID=E7A0T7_SPORE|nr:hypothetical protein sr13757 [Sporisorium reilianum SRZ2]